MIAHLLLGVVAVMLAGHDPVFEAELDAITTELGRGLAGLRLEGSPNPYLAEVRLVRGEIVSLTASYGGITTDVLEKQASGVVQVRVGSPARDDTGYIGSSFEGGALQTFALPLSPASMLARKHLWLAMDASFRTAATGYAKKLTALARLAGDPAPPDFAAGPRATRSLDPMPEGPGLVHLKEPLRELVGRLSGRFERFPGVDNGDVHVQIMRTYELVVTSEGVVVGSHHDRGVLAVVADTRAPDGMHLDDGQALHFRNLQGIDDAFRLRADQLVDGVLGQLDELAKAPMIEEDYDGPILFSALASAQLLATVVAPNLSGTPPPLSDTGRLTSLEPRWQASLGKHVMPRFIDLVDDPRNGFGSYERDGDGFVARPLTLVKAGTLQELLMGRTPNHKRRESNGRARMTPSLTRDVAISNLSLVARGRTMSSRALERELLRRAREDGYEFAYVIDRLRENTILGEPPRATSEAYAGGNKLALPLPARVYRIDAKGKRTLVRGAVLAPISMRIFRRIRVVGNTPRNVPVRIGVGGLGGFGVETGMEGVLSETVDAQVTCPELMIDGMELVVERGEHERLPVLVHPLRRGLAVRRPRRGGA